MVFILSKIANLVDWWISTENHELSFTNIFAKGIRNQKLLIVGHMRDTYEDPSALWVNTARVRKITSKGIYTDSGLLYPFCDAHSLYLNFLSEINCDYLLHAYKWRFDDEDENMVVAHLEWPCGKVKKNVSFHISDLKTNATLPIRAHSVEHDLTVIFSPFSRRGYGLSSTRGDETCNQMYDANNYSEGERAKLIQRINKIRKSIC